MKALAPGPGPGGLGRVLNKASGSVGRPALGGKVTRAQGNCIRSVWVVDVLPRVQRYRVPVTHVHVVPGRRKTEFCKGLSVGLCPSSTTFRRPLVDPVKGGGGGGMRSDDDSDGEPIDTWQKGLLVGIATTYVTLVVVLPFANVFYSAFAKGVGPFIENVMDPDFLHAMKLTLMLAAICVPMNTLFGIVASLNIARNEFWGKSFLISLLDLPFSISPVVVGLMLVLLYGREGLLAPILREYGFSVVFAFPGMVLATLFVTLPFVVRELIPILEGLDPAEEEAARSLGANDFQVFWKVTLPNIRWGLLYGVILTNARAVGEFGAVSVISGNIIGQTQTLTLFVESAYKEYNTEGAFAASVLLSTIALLTLVLKTWLERIAAEERGEA